MNVYSAFDSMPSRLSKHQSAFGKYATSQPATEFGWSPEQSAMLPPNTPVTPGYSATIAPQSLSTNSMELLTPESLEYTHGVATAGNSPLFDELDMGDMQSWESLFADEADAKQAPSTGELPGQGVLPSQDDLPIKEEYASPEPQAAGTVDMTGASPVFTGLPDAGFDFSVFDQISAPSGPQMAAPAAAQAPSPRASPATRGGVSKETAVRSAKVDDLGITVYKRKPRTSPLKPVDIPKDGDEVGAKRAKNTEAARRSRARKLERMTQLEDRIRALMDENEALRAEVTALRNGN